MKHKLALDEADIKAAIRQWAMSNGASTVKSVTLTISEKYSGPMDQRSGHEVTAEVVCEPTTKPAFEGSVPRD